MEEKERAHTGGARFVGGMMLVLLLAACSYAGGRQETVQTVSVPVVTTALEDSEMTAYTAQMTREALKLARTQTLSMLEAVIADERAANSTVAQALEQQRKLAVHIEREAQAQAALELAGYPQAAVSCGDASVSVFVPYEIFSDERDRIRVIDCICSQTGVPAQDVKIILSKK